MPSRKKRSPRKNLSRKIFSKKARKALEKEVKAQMRAIAEHKKWLQAQRPTSSRTKSMFGPPLLHRQKAFSRP